jgi:hypothetical protein
MGLQDILHLLKNYINFNSYIIPRKNLAVQIFEKGKHFGSRGMKEAGNFIKRNYVICILFLV